LKILQQHFNSAYILSMTSHYMLPVTRECSGHRSITITVDSLWNCMFI